MKEYIYQKKYTVFMSESKMIPWKAHHRTDGEIIRENSREIYEPEHASRERSGRRSTGNDEVKPLNHELSLFQISIPPDLSSLFFMAALRSGSVPRITTFFLALVIPV